MLLDLIVIAACGTLSLCACWVNQTRLAIVTPEYRANLLAKSGLRNVVEALIHQNRLRVQQSEQPESQQQRATSATDGCVSQGHVGATVFVRASTFERKMPPTNCFPAVLYTKGQGKGQRSYQVDKDIALNWDPKCDWRAARGKCVYRHVDQPQASAEEQVNVSGGSRETGLQVVPWSLCMEVPSGENGKPKTKAKKRKSELRKLRLPHPLALLLEDALCAGLPAVSISKQVLRDICVGETQDGSEEHHTAKNVLQTLLGHMDWQDDSSASNTADVNGKALQTCRLRLSTDGTVLINKKTKTTIVREIAKDADLRRKLGLVPCHWLELEFSAGVAVQSYSFRATASAACHTNAPSCWILQGHHQSLRDHEGTFEVQSVEGACRDDGWVCLHRVEAGITVPTRKLAQTHAEKETEAEAKLESKSNGATHDKAGKKKGKTNAGEPPAGLGRQTGWEYDTTYNAGEVPGETRFFDVPTEHDTAAPFVRLRWIFFALAEEGKAVTSGKKQPKSAESGASATAKPASQDVESDSTRFPVRPTFSIQLSGLHVYTSHTEANSDTGEI